MDTDMHKTPADLRYAPTHEWIRITDDQAVVGITDHAQHELTDVVFVELPAVGRVLRAGEACAVVESVKTASDIYAPLGGVVVEVNSALSSQPGLVNSDPYGDGWFFRVRLESPTAVADLLTPEAYAARLGPAV